MKLTRLLLITSTMTLASATGWAADNVDAAEHAKHHPANKIEQIAKPVDGQKDSGDMMTGMHEHMQKMQDTMQKIHLAKTEEERKKLMDEHMAQMQQHMKMMQGMGAGMGDMSSMKGKQKEGMSMGMMDESKKCDMMSEGKKCGMMEKMDAMQQMMAQMMEHMAMNHPMEK